ncbi:flagellar motor protein MotB [Sphingomonas jeddahensis]|uniref:Flagellar motor protein MotB n=1 Tax=Sphingomonas jeddahensis TaxID=1915074 RepID=A0A1V2EWB6_9SPHN|nr:flagellar motor protein MotB [Sphingomonas jeddahensis]ONF96775.1 flagellar motor protein MotB [Sphingomonas jeddahensis]
MTVADDFPAAPQGRPLWLITLADLALLLVGFFVLLQANQQVDRKALASGIRAAFGASAEKPAADPLPVAAAGMFNFAPGSATLPTAPDSLIAWAREALRDPRVSLRITAAVDGTPADVDPATGSAAVLAADRARAVGAALAPVAADRLVILTADRPSRRQVVVTLAFTGETQ